MPKLTRKLPSYRHHKKTGQAVVTLNGTDRYLGRFGSEASKELYDQLVAEWIVKGRQNAKECENAPVELTVNQLISRFWVHARQYYRKPNGQPTSEIDTIKQVLKPVIRLYGTTPASAFGPLKLKAVRQKMIEHGWCRNHINKQVSRIKSMFRWAAEEELVPGTIFHALLAVKGLKAGRSEAVESEPVRPVPELNITAIKDHVSRQVWAMIRLQLFTGARPGEIVNLRPIDLDTSGEVWVAELREHKTAHHGYRRTIYLGPQAQKIIEPYLSNRRTDQFLFSPIEAERERRAKVHAERKTPLSCGNKPGSNRRGRPKG